MDAYGLLHRNFGLLEQRNPAYDPLKILAEVWSLSDPNGLSPKVKPGSVDVATLIVREWPSRKLVPPGADLFFIVS